MISKLKNENNIYNCSTRLNTSPTWVEEKKLERKMKFKNTGNNDITDLYTMSKWTIMEKILINEHLLLILTNNKNDLKIKLLTNVRKVCQP